MIAPLLSAVTLSPDSIAQILTPIIGPDQVIHFEDLSVPLQNQIHQTLTPNSIGPPAVFPKTQADLAAVITCAHAHQWRLLICGQGSKLNWGGLTQEIDLLVSTQNLARIIDHATGDLTVTLEAGLPLAKLQQYLAPSHQFLALDPAYPDQATIGGILATRDTGALRHRYGGVRDMVLGVTFVRADGQIAKAGGRVVKNVAGYDLMKLFSGSYGTLAILTQVTLRLYPIPDTSTTIVLTGNTEHMASVTQALLCRPLTPTAIDLLTPTLLSPLNLTGDLGLAVRFQSLPESVAAQCDRLHEIAQSHQLTSTTFTAAEDTQLWDQLQQQLWPSTSQSDPAVTCKLGILPATAAATLTALVHHCHPQGVIVQGRIHAGSGLGTLRLTGDAAPSTELIGALRSHCQQAQGFLTLLQAPSTLKRTLDIWGYTGNALTTMRQLKAKFDPENLLNPGRFVDGI